MFIDRRTVVRIGELLLEEAILDVLFEAGAWKKGDENKWLQQAKISEEAGLYIPKPNEKGKIPVRDGIIHNLLDKLKEQKKVDWTTKKNGNKKDKVYLTEKEYQARGEKPSSDSKRFKS